MDAKVCLRRRAEGGFSLFEALVVIGVIAIASAISIPQVIGARRVLRMAGVTSELTGALRDARQMALTRRRAVTFQYDDDAKRVHIIDHGTDADGLGVSGVEVLSDGNYPETTGSSVAITALLAGGSATASEIVYGAPPDAPTQADTLGDKTQFVALTNNKLNITFQPDGTIIGTDGAPRDVAFAVHNSVQPSGTAAAVSILGATGRIKSWRYSDSVQRFVE